MKLTNVNLSEFDKGDNDVTYSNANLVDEALSSLGFMAISRQMINDNLLRDIFNASKDFFALSKEEKMKSAYLSAGENFGFHAIASEHLDPTKPADLKETFTMRNILNNDVDHDRWPSPEFKDLMQRFFSECLDKAHQLQRVLAKALDIEENFFVNCHTGENVTLRLLHYPRTDSANVSKSQLGAGAHTDYGLFTLLFTDSVEGLEVCDSHGNWLPIESSSSSIIINSGDLLERWTNGKYRSTLHRVKPMIDGQDRFSVAFFVDPDSNTQVDVLKTCICKERPKRYSSITAGDYILRRIQDSQRKLASAG